jgi:hypothetical protein
MTKCNYCGKELNDNTILEVGGNVFCNNLCRHSFEKNGSKSGEGAFPGEPEKEKRQTKSKKKEPVIAGAITAAIVAAVVGLLTTGFMQKDFAGLKEFKSPDNSFTVMLPKDVKEEKQAVNTQLGPIEFVSYNAKAKHQEFSIAYSDYPDSFVTATDPQILLDGSRDGALANIQGRLLSETIIDMNGHPGRELRIEGPQKLILKSRLYLVGNRLYQVMAVSKPDHSFDKKIEEVFLSFKIQKY